MLNDVGSSIAGGASDLAESAKEPNLNPMNWWDSSPVLGRRVEGGRYSVIIFYIVMQAFTLLCFFLWWKAWSGKSTSWLEGRGWGWGPLFFLFGGVFLQSIVFAALAFPMGDSPALVDSDVLRLLMAFMWLVVCPVVLFGMMFWWPRFMLPGWIRERLRAGDPVKTAHPIPEVQHLMTKPQNRRLVSAGASQRGRRAGS